MSSSMGMYKETETKASRVLYINSKDATVFFNNNQSDFDFVLEEPIIVPEHHNMLLSVYSAEIPYSFYNFRIGVNCRLDYQITLYNTPATYDANGFLDLTAAGSATMTLPEGNYNAVQLAKYLSNNVSSAGPVYPLEVKFDPIKLKFSFRCIIAGLRITMALRYGAATGTPENPGEDMNEELGFDFINLQGDPFVELNPAGLNWYNGFSQPNGVGTGVDVIRNGAFFASPAWFLYGDDVVDMTNSIRSLFLRTNLSTTSVLDSHIGGGFSNILTRVPINTVPGGIINVRPVDGDVHKLMLKVKAITDISIQLTNQQNQIINLNGLTFDISLKLEFIEDKILKPPMNLRQVRQQEMREYQAKLVQEENQKLKSQKATSKQKKR